MSSSAFRSCFVLVGSASTTRRNISGAKFGRPVKLIAASSVSVSPRSEEHTSELQSLMRISYAVFCLKKKKTIRSRTHIDKQTAHMKTRTKKNKNNTTNHTEHHT